MERSNEVSKIVTFYIKRENRMEQQIEILKEANRYILKVNNGVEIAITYFRNNELNKGYKLIGEITEGLQWLYDVVRLTQCAQVDKMDATILKETCAEMIEAIENKDSDLLADLLEFEVLERIKIWEKQLTNNVKTYN